MNSRQKFKYTKLKQHDERSLINVPLLGALSIKFSRTYINRILNAANLFAEKIEGYKKPHSLEKMVGQFNQGKKKNLQLNEFESSAILNVIFGALIRKKLLSDDDDLLPGILDDLATGEQSTDLSGFIEIDRETIHQIINDFEIAYSENHFAREILPKAKLKNLADVDYYHSRTIPKEYVTAYMELIMNIFNTESGKHMRNQLENTDMKAAITLHWRDEK